MVAALWMVLILHVLIRTALKANAHRLSNIDADTKTADCSVCGRIKVYRRIEKATPYLFWRCSKKGIEKSTRAYFKSKTKIGFETKRLERNSKARTRHLWKYFRLTPDELDKIIEFERNHPVYKILLGKRNVTDHDHATGLVRGSLEWRINRAYGLLDKVVDDKDLPTLLRALADFHEHPPVELALGEKKYGIIGQAQSKKKMVYGPPK